MQLQLELFLVFVQKFQKNANKEKFLIKVVNINNHTTHHFLYGVLILQDAKNHSQHKKKRLKPSKKNLFAGQIKRA